MGPSGWLRRGGRLLAELGLELHSLRANYPAFVTRDTDGLPAGEVPVFTFHSIEPEPFEAQLRHLQRNGYRTIDGPSLCRHLRGEAPAPEGSVMLTIDDGRKSVWTYGFPLLRRYGFTATAFIIPGYVPAGDELSPNLDDVRAGRLPASGLSLRDPELMNWQELRTMQEAGVIDCQSHTYYHHRVPTQPTLTGFVAPTTRDAYFDVSVPVGEEWRLLAGGVPGGFGMPLFAAAPLMLAQPRYHPAPGVVDACVALVREAGGERFFAAPEALDRLHATYTDAVRRHGPGRLEAPAEVLAAMQDDLARSRAVIEAELGGKPCTQLCFPYTEGSEAALELAAAVGYEAAYWGILPGRTGNRPGDDCLRIVRLKHDYIHRLPGAGRRSLASIMLDKVARRVAGRPIY